MSDTNSLVLMDSLTNRILSTARVKVQSRRAGQFIRDSQPNLQEDTLDRERREPARRREEFHTHCTACGDMPAAALGESDETRLDDAKEWRRQGKFCGEAHFHDDAIQSGLVEVARYLEVLVETVEFDDPLVDVVDMVGVNVPA